MLAQCSPSVGLRASPAVCASLYLLMLLRARLSSASYDEREWGCRCPPAGRWLHACQPSACPNASSYIFCGHTSCPNLPPPAGKVRPMPAAGAAGRFLVFSKQLAAGAHVCVYHGTFTAAPPSAVVIRRGYCFAVSDGWVVAKKNGQGAARLAQHSCRPTCRAELWLSASGRRIIVFVTVRAVRPGAACTINYGWSRERWAEVGGCQCGESTCRF